MDLPAAVQMSAVGKIPSGRRRNALSAVEPPARRHALWISWNSHRRTTGLCAAWDLPLHIIRSSRKGLGRWIEQTVDTLRLLRHEKPEILFVQNPSLALTVLATVARRLFGYYLVVDAHNEGVRPFDRPGAFVGWLTRRLLKSADVTIVTNAALAKDVSSAGGRPRVLPDSLPVPPLLATRDVIEDPPHVVAIATFRADEPIAAIVAAAATMPEIRFSFSGDARRFNRSEIPLPANVRLTGYLPDRAYWQLLAQAAVICDLTLKPDCLVCGAYEGLAMAKPLVLSDNPPTREIFGAAAVLTGSGPDEIASALRTALEQRERLEANARDVREAFRARWQVQAAATWDAIHAGAAAASRQSPDRVHR
jgi:glycosyltransferase involved in cell wall biosynthesis